MRQYRPRIYYTEANKALMWDRSLGPAFQLFHFFLLGIGDYRAMCRVLAKARDLRETAEPTH
jgi:hypothetical protein